MNTLIQKALVLALGLFAFTQTAFSTTNSSTVACQYETYAEQHICTYDSFYFDGEWIRIEGEYQATFTDVNGCDSIVHLSLWYMPNSLTEMLIYLCQGEQLDLNGFVIESAGTYQIHYQASWGCDSTVILHVQMLAAASSEINRTLCQGDSTFFGGGWLKETGTYIAKYPRAGACDSTVTLELEIIQTKIPVTMEVDGLYAAAEVDDLQWLFCPSYAAIPNATEAKLTLTKFGRYALRIENKGCIDTVDCISFSTTGIIKEETHVNEWKAYPNPVQSTLNIEGDFEKEIHIHVFTLMGQEVLTIVMEPNGLLQLDMRALASGRYILRIDEDSKLPQSKIIEIR